MAGGGLLVLALRAPGLAVTGRARLSYADVPPAVRSWVEELLGSPVETVEEQDGGMSPGCASRVRCADGSRAFVKAVGSRLNPDTPALFRREATVLRLIGDGHRWADLRGFYDSNTWVALVIEDVEGRHPDLHDTVDLAAVLAAVDGLGPELAARVPHPPAPDPGPWPGTGGLLDLAGILRTWARSFDEITAHPDLVPRWVVAEAEALRPGIVALAGCPADQVVHWDVRDDNLLVRPDGSVVVVDWGGAGVGAGWMDPLLARFGRAEDRWFDTSLAAAPGLSALGTDLDDVVTSWLVAFGCHLAWRSHSAVDVNLPRLADFRRRESARALAGAARRLGFGGNG